MIIFFDFWGTLVENGTYSPLKQTYRAIAPRMSFGEFVVKFESLFMTKRFANQEEAFNAVIDSMGMQPNKFVVDKLIGLWNKHRLLAAPYPETFDVLKDLRKDHKLVLVSNTDCFVESVFEKFDIPSYFDVVRTSYETGLLKTNPKTFHGVLDELGLSKDDAVMVGDSMETDIVGAQKAGIRAILVDRRNTRNFSPKVTDLRQLREIIEE